MQQIISLLMENKPGALMRVTGVLSQRGYNIESLTVSRTIDPALSRMTISVDVEANIRPQVIKQMNKLVNVLQATDVTEGPGIHRELILLRVRSTPESRASILKEANLFKAQLVDSTNDSLVLEATGEDEKLEELINSMTSFGATEVTRSGVVSMSLDNRKMRLSPPVARRVAREESLELQQTE